MFPAHGVVSQPSAAAWYAGAIAAYQPKGAASLAASYVNLANPGTYDAAPGVAPTWDAATGWTFNGSTQHLASGVIPDSGWSALVRFSNVTNLGYVAGEYVSASSLGYLLIQPNFSRFYNDNFLPVAPAITSGIIGMAGVIAYKNGTSVGTGTNTGHTASNLFIGAYHLNGTSAAGFLAGKIQAVAIYDTTLSAAQVLSVSTAMAAL